jgi:hypothetical protein
MGKDALLKSPEIEKIAGIYRRANQAIVRTLMAVKMGGYTEARAIAAGRRIGEIVRKLNKAVERWAGPAVKKAYMERAKSAKAALAIIGAKKNNSYDKKTPSRSMREVAEYMERDLLKANSTIKKQADIFLYLIRRGAQAAKAVQMFDEWDAEVATKLFREWAAKAVAEGWARKELTGMIEDYLMGEISEDGFIEINGRHYILEKYAELVASVRFREAQTEAIKNMCAEYENDLVVWSSHANPCEDCATKEGQVYSLSGKNPLYPILTGEDEPPLHPHCGHSISPTSEEGIEIAELFGGVG